MYHNHEDLFPRLERFRDAVEGASSAHHVDKLFGEFSKPLGVDHYTCAIIRGRTDDVERSKLVGNFETRWLKHYMMKKYFLDDAVISLGVRSKYPFTYSKLVADGKITDAARRVMLDAWDHGLKDGLVVPLFTADGEISLFSMAGREFPSNPQLVGALQLAATHAHAKVMEIREKQEAEEEVVLTTRQSQVFKLLSEGKTDGEIAQILKISEGTVSRHFDDGKNRLGVVTRFQAGARAEKHGLLS